jgi:hypothetical protein
LITTTPGVNSRRALIRSALWLCNRCCHHRFLTYSEIYTAINADAVGKHQPVSPVVQLPGQVAVLAQDGCQHREAVERGVRGQDQNACGGRREQVDTDPLSNTDAAI